MNNITECQTFLFGTKGETLQNIKPLINEALVPDLYLFTVEQWVKERQVLLGVIRDKFQGDVLAVRSSALAEDGAESSMAGAFLSKLNVCSANYTELETAIDDVVQSMTGNPRDQILVQPMVRDISVSGVIMTFDMVHGAPYYCIDFDDETGRTDVVTGGNGIHKSLFVYRGTDNSMIRSTRISSFIKLARELESVCACAALDIEFGMNKLGQLFLFQVRRITLARNWHPVTERRVKRQLVHIENFLRNCSKRRDCILGSRTILGIMPDWNPAEIIGTSPRPLAASLYRQLITKTVWCRARASMGYRSLGDADLMVLINSSPYIDVRNSFNSFLPAHLPDDIGEKLIDAWLARLEAFPELHDKVEFEIVPTCLDFCFHEDFAARYPNVLSKNELEVFRIALTKITRDCLAVSPDSTLDRALEASLTLERLQLPIVDDSEGYAHLERANYLLTQCREFGSFSFAVVARHAFIAETLLRSAVKRGALTEARLIEFRRSIHTITSSMIEECALVCNGQLSPKSFYRKYGHLRPGTYEITSLRYDERDDLFLDVMLSTEITTKSAFTLTTSECTALEALLLEADSNVLTVQQLLSYAAKAIAGREQVKFVFTRSLSEALSAIMYWGEFYGLSRDDLSYLDWPEIANCLSQPIIDDIDRRYLDIADTARKNILAANTFKLGHLVFGTQDIYVATLNRSVPNFVGSGSATGKIIQLEASTPTTINIKGNIVCIENADPGFDWIFTKSPIALITRFGGANSHMAVRSAEFGLPAAIGCGDQIYQKIIKAGSVELNCMEKILRPLYVH